MGVAAVPSHEIVMGSHLASGAWLDGEGDLPQRGGRGTRVAKGDVVADEAVAEGAGAGKEHEVAEREVAAEHAVDGVEVDGGSRRRAEQTPERVSVRTDRGARY